MRNASYRNHGTHAEAIEVVFDPSTISYRTILDLESSTAASPIRLALMDFDKNGKFELADLNAAAGAIVDKEPAVRADDRFDFNGDGFTSMTRKRAFDLNADGIVGSLFEGAVSDLGVMCLYAYTARYTGDKAKRDELVGAACKPVKDGVLDTPTGLAEISCRYTVRQFTPVVACSEGPVVLARDADAAIAALGQQCREAGALGNGCQCSATRCEPGAVRVCTLQQQKDHYYDTRSPPPPGEPRPPLTAEQASVVPACPEP